MPKTGQVSITLNSEISKVYIEIEDSESEEDNSFVKNAVSHNNPYITFKQLDTFSGAIKEKENVSETGDKKLLLPTQKDVIERPDTGFISNKWTNSIQDKSVENLMPRKNTMERRNTPSIQNSVKLIEKIDKTMTPNNRIAFKVKDTPAMSLNPRLRKASFMRKATIAFRKRAEVTSKKFEKRYKKLKEKEELYESMLLMLVENGENGKLVDLLKKINIDLEKEDADGNTLFNIAVQNGYYDIVLTLLGQGVNVNTQNKDGNSPLHFAQTYNFTNILNLLIHSGADQRAANNKGRTPWEGL